MLQHQRRNSNQYVAPYMSNFQLDMKAATENVMTTTV